MRDGRWRIVTRIGPAGGSVASEAAPRGWMLDVALNAQSGNENGRIDSMPDESRPTQTILGAGSAGSSSESIEEGRFPAGTILAGRYRILGLLGRGGMGEVYRALDLILNQPVALKFLLNAEHAGKAALARLRDEVRIARQVSHPNVCRVYDIGVIEGLHFLSMEYVDGEDASSAGVHLTENAAHRCRSHRHLHDEGKGCARLAP